MMHTASLLGVCLAFAVIVFPSSVASSPSALSQKAANLRDLVNVKSSKTKKAKKYKCFLVEEDEEGNEILIPVSNTPKKAHKHPVVDKRKFVYDDDADNSAKAAVPHSNNVRPTLPVAPPTLATTTQKPVTAVVSSAFLQTDTEFEKLGESEASMDMPPVYQEPIKNLVTLPPRPATPVESTVQRPKLKQVHLPRAHGIPVNGRRIVTETTTIPPEVVTAPRDAQNRPLVLAPEHCGQIKHYADMYGVRDVKGWVHNNCGFAQTYLPTASCEEIDILVASCKNV
uniref:Secreted protein n=1 Tax=Panagrellus redivivus TaxID=6233 RepID=A0A7E4ZTX3_PANRE